METRDLRNSEIKDLERCPYRWHWGWNEGLTPLRPNTKLWMGIGVHEALADWYLLGRKRGPHPAETWQQFCKNSADVDRSIPQPVGSEGEEIEWQDAVDLGTYVLEQYVETYGKDSKYHFIATEQTFNMMLLTPKQYKARLRRKHIARLVGTWDGVYRDLETGEVWLIEHKTSAVGGVPRFIKMLPIDQQTNTYYMSATYILRKQGLLKPNENIAGIMFNWLEKYKPSANLESKPIGPDGTVRNKPQKIDYYNALRDHPKLPVELEATRLPPIADMQMMADKLGVEVFGKPSANQPRLPSSYFTREPAFRSNHDLRYTYEAIGNVGVKRQNYLDGLTPLTKNPTMDCSWDCNFFKLCQMHSAGEDWEDYKGMAFTVDDRYADHNNRKKA